MSCVEQPGFLLIADITGFTTYLSESEIEHAQGTLTDLLELLVDRTPAPLVVSQLEGDAVMSYAFQDGFVGGQSFLEAVEDIYFAFRRAIELKVLNNTCRCNACANVSSLDLKFFVHYGSFVVQPVGDRNQLLGSDVNLIHRLLKNTVTAETGIRAYILCTEAAVEALGLDRSAVEMIELRQEVTDFGELTLVIKDMHPVYEARRDEGRVEYDAVNALGTISVELSMPRELVWDYLSRPKFRSFAMGSDRQEVIDRKAGRIGEGSTYVCYHGDMTVSHLILEWSPFDRIVIQQEAPFMGRTVVTLLDFALIPLDEKTRLDQTLVYEGTSRLMRVVGHVLVAMTRKHTERSLQTFKEAIERDRGSHDTPSRIELSPAEYRRAAVESLHGPDAG